MPGIRQQGQGVHLPAIEGFDHYKSKVQGNANGKGAVELFGVVGMLSVIV
jgi:hypothetical protein